MMPSVTPAPLSAWTLLGVMTAWPQPLARNCCCQVGPLFVPPNPARGKRLVAFVPRNPPNPPMNPNCIITGTGPVAFAGDVRDTWMFTVISGYDELSTLPASCFVMTGTSPLFVLVVLVTSHFTAGVFLGTRP